MQLKNVYPKFMQIKIDDVFSEKIDVELLTPEQLQMLYRNCIRFMKNLDDMGEKEYERIGEAEYTKREHKYDEVEQFKDFMETQWGECLV